MSSWCRNVWWRNVPARLRVATVGILAALCLAAPPPGRAQQLYFVPSASAKGEYDTNYSLTPNGKKSPGYSVVAEGWLKRFTTLDELTVHPFLSYMDFPKVKRMNTANTQLDLEYDRHTQRLELGVTGEFQRQDVLNTQFGQAAFNAAGDTANANDTGANNPNTNGGGVTQGGFVETRYILDPTVAYKLTQLVKLESEVREDHIQYSSGGRPDTPIGYDFHSVSVSLLRQFAPRLYVGAGPYWSQFKSANHINESDGYGLESHMRYEWSQITRLVVELDVEKDHTYQQGTAGTSTAWSLTANGTTRMVVGSLRYSVGRFIEPSNVGSRTTLDQVRFQYIRPLSARLGVNVAASYGRLKIIGNAADQLERDRTNAEAFLNYQITPTVSVQGGYRYGGLDLKGTYGLIRSNGVSLTLTYRGLDPHARQ